MRVVILIVAFAALAAGAVMAALGHRADGGSAATQGIATAAPPGRVAPEPSSDAAQAPTVVASAPAIEGSPGCGTPVATGDRLAQIDTDQGLRTYRLHVPERYREGIPTPLLLNFSGYGRSALEQETYSGLVTLSERRGVVLVTPGGSGSPPAWDIPGIYAENGYDDVAFVVLLLGQLEADLCIDPSRVFATGLSNGAEMASLLACRRPDLFAAVAPVAGVIYDGCEDGRVAVIAFHGTQDDNIPFEYAPPALAAWARHNGCEPGMHDTQVSDHVTAWAFAGCDGADVVLYAVDGGGHTWPGAEDNAGGVGPTTHEIDANEVMWEFFAAHPKVS